MNNGIFYIKPFQTYVLKDVIYEKGFGQVTVANILGCAPSTFNKYLNGRTSMPSSFARELYSFLDNDPRIDFLCPKKSQM